MKKMMLYILLLILSVPVIAGKPKLVIEGKTECPPEKPLQDWNNRCFSCDTLEGVNLDKKMKEKGKQVCPEREIYEADVLGREFFTPRILSLPKNCPKEKPLRTVEGCVICDDQAHQVPVETDCSACSSLQIRSKPRFINCLPACSENKILASTGHHYFRCISCDEKYVDGISEEDCKKCSNRIWNLTTQKCEFKESPCSEGEFLIEIEDSIYECESCESGYIESFSEEICKKCPSYRYWDVEKGICEFKKSPYPDKPVIVENICYSRFINNTKSPRCYEFLKCNEARLEYIIDFRGGKIRREFCDLCPNLKYVDGECVLK